MWRETTLPRGDPIGTLRLLLVPARRYAALVRRRPHMARLRRRRYAAACSVMGLLTMAAGRPACRSAPRGRSAPRLEGELVTLAPVQSDTTQLGPQPSRIHPR